MANERTVNLVLSELNLRKHTLTSITPLGIFLLKFFIIIYHYGWGKFSNYCSDFQITRKTSIQITGKCICESKN